jgi:uncharacterized lipoprotein YddW (UPF0748 family)
MIKNKPSSLIICVLVLYVTASAVNGHASISKQTKKGIVSKGVWVTVFSEKKVMYSREGVLSLVESCKKTGINEIYLQLYRAGQAYYDSQISDRTKYEEIVKEAGGIDTIDLLLREARKNDIKVFAWINVLSLAQNKKAPILAKYGNSVLTRDQYLRASIRTEEANESDKYYLRDDQLFLEPGDPRVAEYLVSIASEIVDRYSLISGIHLDYIRYPHPVPFVPGSRFNKYGLTYGYGESNIKRFKEATKLDPISAKDNEDISYKWDDWKRHQVTNLTAKISRHIKGKSKDLLVSCAVMPSPDRAYSVAFQDWPLWLDKEIVDYVVLMNYTRDDRLAEATAKSALAHNGKGKIFVGIGAFLLKNDPEIFLRQYAIIASLNPDGIVLFSYDEVPDTIIKNINNVSHVR